MADDAAPPVFTTSPESWTPEQVERFKAEFDRAFAESHLLRERVRPLGRDEIIARLAKAFGPHLAPVPRDTGDPKRDRGRSDYVPDGNDEQGSTMIVFRDTDGCNGMRALTYGEIADALCGNGQQEEPRA